MNTHRFDPHHTEGFTSQNAAKIAAKLTRFAAAGPDRIYYLFDFDRTLTTSKHTGDNTTSWEIFHGLLPAAGQKTDNELRTKYLALEAVGLLSQEDSQTWLASQLGLHTEHGTTIHAIQKAVENIKLRDSSTEVFAACEAAHIPTVILSGGIRNIIEMILHAHRIHPTMLLSIQLEFDDHGRMNGWNKDSVVLTTAKHETVKQWLKHITAVRPFTVLIGDTIEDARMVTGDEDVLRIRVCDLKSSQCASHDEYLAASFKAGYDLVVEEDLAPLIELTRWLQAASGQTVSTEAKVKL